jgi:hypothetical protein
MISYDKFFWEKFMKRSGAALKKLARFASLWWRLGCAELKDAGWKLKGESLKVK